LKELSLSCVKDVQFLAQAHVRLFSETLAERALASRESSVKSLEQALAEIGQVTLETLRKQMEQELETLMERASAQADQLAERVLKAMESRISSIQLRVVSVRTRVLAITGKARWTCWKKDMLGEKSIAKSFSRSATT